MAMSGAERVRLYRQRKAAAGQTLVWTEPAVDGAGDAKGIATAWSAAVDQLMSVRTQAKALLKKNEIAAGRINVATWKAMAAWEAEHPQPEYTSPIRPKPGSDEEIGWEERRAAYDAWGRAHAAAQREARAAAVAATGVTVTDTQDDDATTDLIERIADLDLKWLRRAQPPRGKYMSRAARWQGAVDELRQLIGEYEERKGKLDGVDNFQNSPLYEKLDAVCSIDLDELESVDLPVGWGRD